MPETMRECLDESIDGALKDKLLVKSRHGALIKAAQRCADRIDNADEVSPSLLSTMLNYIRALGLAPDNEAVNRRYAQAPKKKESSLDGMRKSFHVA